MKKHLLPLALLFSGISPAQALDVGDISSFMNSDSSTLSKTIKNSTDSGRLINIRLERLSSPLDDGQVISMDKPDELLLTPASLLLPAQASEVIRFFYKGPADEKERYYRIVWFDQALSDAQRDNANRSAVATASARIGTILVVAPRQANYHFQYANGSLTNTGNATLRILAYGPCLKAANGKECKENYYLMPGKSRRFTRVDTADNKGRVALWQGDKFIPVKWIATMPLRRFSPGLKAQFAFGMVFLFVQPDASAADISAQQIGGVIIPQAFSQALQDGMSVPLYIHLAGSQGRQDDQRIGSAFIWLDDGQLRIRKIQLEESEDNASVSEQTRQQLMTLANAPFNEALTIPLTDNAQLDLSLRQLLLQLVVKREALGTVLRSRSEDIGQSSVNTLSSNLSYNLGVYNNQLRNGGSNTSSYLSLNNVTALREHHVVLDGSLYGIGSGQQDSELYKAMYERDFAGHRFAGGMLDTWNLQSLGPMTAISAGKIYGLSWGNQASSTIFDSSQSATPVIAFLPAAGEVHLTRDGRLLSVQNFTMGNHEVDTRGLPYGIYDVEVEVIVNGRVISKRTQRVNKLFSRGRGVGAPLAWQVWDGSFHMDRWSENGKKTRPAKESWLAGASTSGSLSTLSWAATGYGYDNQAVGETRLTLPLGGAINVNLQNMLASDSSWSSIGSISATLPGGFSSLWVNQEKTRIGNQLRRSDADNRAIGGTLNLNSLWSKLGTFSISYNDDRRYNSHYYTADYYQNVYSGTFGSLGLRAGIQRYNNGDSNANTGKYIALDLSLPLGNWFSAGMTHQNGYTMANLSARKQFDEGTIRTVGANLSRAISGDTGDDKTLSGGAYAQFDARYASGTLNVNSAADGYVNTNLTANGSVGWQGKNIAASGRTDGNAGVIFNTGLEDDGQISAKINGRIFPLNGKRNYLPLSPYGRYEVELQNSKNSLDSYDIVSGRKSRLTLYPGNVAVIEPEVKQMVTVSGRIRAEDGTLLANARINNHIGRTRTDENGEFVMDVDKKYPTIDFRYSGNKTCEVALELNQARGAVWVGDVVCSGLSSWAAVTQTGEENES